MAHTSIIPLLLTHQPEGGYTMTSPLLPELVTEGDTVEEALRHVQDAFRAVVELYADLDKTLSVSLQASAEDAKSHTSHHTLSMTREMPSYSGYETCVGVL